MQTEWNIQALALKAQEDLAQCHTALERSMAQTINAKEIRRRAQELHAQGRLTPGGRAIAEKHGFRI